MNIVFVNLFQVLLSFLVSVQRLEIMPQRLVRLQFVVGSLHREFAGAVIGIWVEFTLPQFF
jgi:hypothetical protein